MGEVHVRTEERRKHRRLVLRLPITRLQGQQYESAADGAWTRNVSAGGMYFVLPASEAPKAGQELHFEMTVPPGEGYSSYIGRISGWGQVARTAPQGTDSVGVALRFTHELGLAF